jgi:hypothetical protein
MPGQFVTETMLPEVADALYEVCQEFGCDLRWMRDSKDQSGTREEFRAEPLSPDRPVSYGISTNVSTKVWYGEYQWQRLMRGANLDRGKPDGYVKFEASMNAGMSMPKGLDLFDTTSDGRKRFLCWADQHELGDGSICFRLNTNAGSLWIRGADQSRIGTRMLHSGLSGEGGTPKFKGHTVVQLEEYDFCLNVGEKPFYEQTPWDRMMSTDRTKRQWHIIKGSLSLYCALRLNVVGRYNDRLKDRPRHVVEWPYQTVWEQWAGDDEKLLVPLDYF